MWNSKVPEFDVGTTFPHGDTKSVLAIRFLVASQSLASIARILGQLGNDPGSEESKQFLMVLSIGTANEAAIAFQEADAAGVFADLDASAWKEQKDRLARLRVDANHKDTTSLRELLIRTTRNKIGFHWDKDYVTDSLKELASARGPVWEGASGGSVGQTPIPLVRAVVTKSLERIAGSKKDLDTLIVRIAQFQGNCFHVAHAMFTLQLKKAGVGAGGA